MTLESSQAHQVLPPIGAALEISLRKKSFQTLFFTLQTCRYGVSYEISSRHISKKVIFLCSMSVFLCFFSFCWEKCFFGGNSCYFVCWLALQPPFRLHLTFIHVYTKFFCTLVCSGWPYGSTPRQIYL
jgi:hypothetical protein